MGEKCGSEGLAGNIRRRGFFREIVFNCTSGNVSVEALRMAGAQNLKGKVLVDVANALDFSKGMPPTLTIVNTDSVGEQIQREFPEAKVVKSLNTMAAQVMVNPMGVPGEHDVFVCGNDPQAKAQVQKILGELGWKSIIDLGDISTSRGVEMWFTLFFRLRMKYQTPMFNLHIQRQS